jgi:hypothetical protein
MSYVNRYRHAEQRLERESLSEREIRYCLGDSPGSMPWTDDPDAHLDWLLTAPIDEIRGWVNECLRGVDPDYTPEN